MASKSIPLETWIPTPKKEKCARNGEDCYYDDISIIATGGSTCEFKNNCGDRFRGFKDDGCRSSVTGYFRDEVAGCEDRRRRS